MQTQEVTNTSPAGNKLHPANPFSVIPCPLNHRVKIWDFELEGTSYKFPVKIEDLIFRGRVRLLAVVPKKPEPLENIKFSIAWCSPVDIKNFNKARSNKILIGRYLSHHVNGKTNNSSGTVTKIDTLQHFQVEAFNALFNVPNWVKDSHLIMQRTSTIEINFDEDTNSFEVEATNEV